ncbi:MAG: S41 family peptidase [Candidatus Acidiferrales bacterium]
MKTLRQSIHNGIRRCTENPKFVLTAIFLLLLGFSSRALTAQSKMPPPPSHSTAVPNQPIDKTTIEEVVNAAGKALDSRYVFPDTGAKLAAMLRSNEAKHEYDSITSGTALADRLTTDIYAVAHDKHIRLRYPDMQVFHAGPPTPEEQARMKRGMAWENNGFTRVERLDGNVGYIKIDALLPTEMGGDTAKAAMAFVINTDALIIDLRENGGGTPEMIDLLCTYLFPVGQRVHLNDFQDRGRPGLQEFFTFASIPGGKSLAGKPVYVLTSHDTFSGGEELAYDLQTQKRATLIGEVTRGGANPGGPVPLPAHFTIFVPTGRAINPITKTNWEGVGVKPDIEVPADQSLGVAEKMALTAIEKKVPPVGPQHDEIEDALKALKAKGSK